ncbi:MAG: hypothetical protein EA382_12370 [Spirochaetaceae bacterium]|nr:MAG: hypothetical protein EA382_12370 [Spirochaetaceae bacterium]
MSTELLYYRSPPPEAFTARVVDARRPTTGEVEVVLDRTAFYPEGGGQPCDTGSIAGSPVLHVSKEDDVVVHRIGGATPEVGDEVSCAVDALRRRDFQQQHTGQHVVSAVLLRTGGYNTVGVHQGDAYTTIEVDASQIPAATLDAVEDAANAVIMADLPVTTEWADESTINRFPLRRPPKVSGSIRIVQIADLDCVACGGVHVGRTGEIRLIRIIGTESIRGNTRIIVKIGDRALRDYRDSSTIVSGLCRTLSAQPAEIEARVCQLTDRAERAEAAVAERDARLQHLTAGQLRSQSRSIGNVSLITSVLRDESSGFLRGVTETLIAEGSTVVAIASVEGDRVLWSVGASPDTEMTFTASRARILAVIDGKGGGKPPIWQGVGTRPDAIDTFMSAIAAAVETGSL